MGTMEYPVFRSKEHTETQRSYLYKTINRPCCQALVAVGIPRS